MKLVGQELVQFVRKRLMRDCELELRTLKNATRTTYNVWVAVQHTELGIIMVDFSDGKSSGVPLELITTIGSTKRPYYALKYPYAVDNIIDELMVVE